MNSQALGWSRGASGPLEWSTRMLSWLPHHQALGWSGGASITSKMKIRLFKVNSPIWPETRMLVQCRKCYRFWWG